MCSLVSTIPQQTWESDTFWQARRAPISRYRHSTSVLDLESSQSLRLRRISSLRFRSSWTGTFRRSLVLGEVWNLCNTSSVYSSECFSMRCTNRTAIIALSCPSMSQAWSGPAASPSSKYIVSRYTMQTQLNFNAHVPDFRPDPGSLCKTLHSVIDL